MPSDRISQYNIAIINSGLARVSRYKIIIERRDKRRPKQSIGWRSSQRYLAKYAILLGPVIH
jgi:hypothetical protein